MTLFFHPLDDRWFALVCSTAFGCWWIWMLLMPKHWAHIPLRHLPLTRVLWVLLLAAMWPVVMVAQFALGYDWHQFGKDYEPESAASETFTRLPATVTGQNRGERVQPHVAPREIAVRGGAIRGAMFVFIPALIFDVLSVRQILHVIDGALR